MAQPQLSQQFIQDFLEALIPVFSKHTKEMQEISQLSRIEMIAVLDQFREYFKEKFGLEL